MKKIFLFSSIAIIAILSSVLIFSSCQKEENIEKESEAMVDAKDAGEIVNYAFQQKVTVKDESGQYYVVVNLQSNSEKLLQQAIDAKPYLTINPKIDDAELSGENLSLSSSKEITSSEETNDVLYQLTEDRNIPSNFTYAFHQGQVTNLKSAMAGCGVAGDPVSTATFLDDLAIKVYTSNSTSCPIQFTYYSKGCCWYSIGYYDRGVRHLSNGSSHTFNASGYSPYTGVKVRASRFWNLTGLTWYKVQ